MLVQEWGWLDAEGMKTEEMSEILSKILWITKFLAVTCDRINQKPWQIPCTDKWNVLKSCDISQCVVWAICITNFKPVSRTLRLMSRLSCAARALACFRWCRARRRTGRTLCSSSIPGRASSITSPSAWGTPSGTPPCLYHVHQVLHYTLLHQDQRVALYRVGQDWQVARPGKRSHNYLVTLASSISNFCCFFAHQYMIDSWKRQNLKNIWSRP